MKRIFVSLFMMLVAIMLIGCSSDSSNDPSSEDGVTEAESSTEESSEAESAGEPLNLEMATLSQGSAWYVYGATMAELLQNEVEEINRIDVLAYAGGFGNVTILDDREADMAFTFNLNNNWGYNGEVAYDKKHEDMRMSVGGLDDYYVGIILTDDFIKKHDVTSLADIKEKQLPVRLLTVDRGSQGEVATQHVLEAFELDYDELKSFGGSVEHTSFDVVKSAFQDGKGDMFVQVMPVGHPAFTEIALQTDVTFMPVEDEYLENVTKYGNYRATVPAGVYNGQDHEVPTLGLTTTLVVNEEFPEEAAYQITKTLIENKDKLAEGHNGLADFDPEEGITEDSTGGIPIHEGAKRYYQEMGWMD